MKTQRWIGCFLTTLLLCLLLCSCGMNQEKAIEQMRQALLTSSTMESGKLSAQMTAQVELGADSIPMELSIEGEFQDQLQTMAMQGRADGTAHSDADLPEGRFQLHPR